MPNVNPEEQSKEESQSKSTPSWTDVLGQGAGGSALNTLGTLLTKVPSTLWHQSSGWVLGKQCLQSAGAGFGLTAALSGIQYLFKGKAALNPGLFVLALGVSGAIIEHLGGDLNMDDTIYGQFFNGCGLLATM